MAALSGIEPVSASPRAETREQKGGAAATDFGAAVTHRDLVREKLRVDPTAVADKTRAAKASRPSPRDERLAAEEQAYFDSLIDQKGRTLDIKV
ncbi:MAG: hypothetical protein AB7O98_11285 [Hyphomonadaceae bacterium]